MSNRQARREQTRQSRPVRTNRPAPGKQPVKKGGDGPDWLSRPFLLAISAVIVVLAIILSFFFAKGSSGDAAFVTKLEQAQKALPKDLQNGTKLGKDDAPVKLVSYEDFQCPFCLQYTANQEGELIEKYVKTGEVQLEFRHLAQLGAESVRSAIASQCAADQNKFWEYQNKLFRVQAEAGQFKSEKKDAGRFSDNNLKGYAKDVGLQSDTFDKCLDSSQHLDLVQQPLLDANAQGITSTPGFVVNGSPLGSGAPATIEGWKQIFDQVKTAGSATPSATASASASPAGSATAAGTATAPSSSPTAAAAATATKTP